MLIVSNTDCVISTTIVCLISGCKVSDDSHALPFTSNHKLEIKSYWISLSDFTLPQHPNDRMVHTIIARGRAAIPHTSPITAILHDSSAAVLPPSAAKRTGFRKVIKVISG